MDVPEGSPPRTQRLGGDQGAVGEGVEGSGQNPDPRECSTGVRPEEYLAQGLRLPCQNSHKCTSTGVGDAQKAVEFPASARRTAFALQVNVAAMVERHGIAQVGFLTLTFAEHILDPKVAQQRMHSLVTHVLKPRYRQAIRVIERQKSGRIHYHLLVAMETDIRTGCDFDAFARGDYRSAPPDLRAEWAFWRSTAKKYRFGRTELLPVMSTGEAVSRYVGKYIAKHLDQRKREDKRVRLVSYMGTRVASTRFAWASGGAKLWRQKLRGFVEMLHGVGAIASPTLQAMRLRFGPRWANYWRDSIATFPIQQGEPEHASCEASRGRSADSAGSAVETVDGGVRRVSRAVRGGVDALCCEERALVDCEERGSVCVRCGAVQLHW